MFFKSIAALSLFALVNAGYAPPTQLFSCKPAAFVANAGTWTGIVTARAVIGNTIAYTWSFDLAGEVYGRILPFPVGTGIIMSSPTGNNPVFIVVKDSGDSSCVLAPTTAKVAGAGTPKSLTYKVAPVAPCATTLIDLNVPVGPISETFTFKGSHAGKPVGTLTMEFSLFAAEYTVKMKMPYPANSIITSSIITPAVKQPIFVQNFTIPAVLPGSTCVLGH